MQPQVRSVTPILPVEDISATLEYYTIVLGATNSWKWGEPANHAGCDLGAVNIHFTLDPELCRCSRGLSLFLNVLEIESYYKRHVDSGAKMVETLEPKPWGAREYTVEDCNGVRLRFIQGGFTTERRERLEGVSIVPRALTVDELRELLLSVHWDFDDNEESLSKTTRDPIYTAVAEYEGRCIGAGGILGHETGHYLIFNIMVHPEYQSKGVGKQIMKAIDEWLTKHGVPGAYVKLFTGLDRQPFYGQFGFVGPEKGLVGMTKIIPKKT